MIDVSVIAPVYNVEKYLVRSITSVVRQSWENIEIILVDDGSTDSSGSLCDELAAKDARIRVIHKENQGTGYARNTGLAAAKGEYVYFFDPDDFITPDLIKDNLDLARREDADVVIFGYQTAWLQDDGSVKLSTDDGLPRLEGAFTYGEFWNHFDQIYNRIANIWIMLLRRQHLIDRQIAFTSLPTGQDVYFTYALYGSEFHKIAFNRRYYYQYSRRAGSAMTVYKPSRTEDIYQCSAKFDEVVSAATEANGRYRDIVAKRYLSGLCMSLDNLTRGRRQRSFKRRADEFSAVCKREKVRNALKEYAAPPNARQKLGLKERLIVGGRYRMALLYSDISTAWHMRNRS